MVVAFGDIAVLVAAILTLGVALFVLFLDFSERVHRAFALFLVLKAMLDGFLFFAGPVPDRLRVYWLIAVPFAALHFCLAYRRKHGHRPNPKAAWGWPLAILAVALALEVAYLVDHSLFGLPPEPPGPLIAFVYLRFPAYALVTLLFAFECQRTTHETGRTALLLAGTGMAFVPLFFCSFEIAINIQRLAQGDEFRVQAEPLFYALGFAMVVEALRRLAVAATPRQRRAILVASGAVLLTSASVFVAYQVEGANLVAEQLLRFFLAVWALAVPIGVTYALVRYRLFDAEVKLRFAIKGTSLATVFVATFIVVGKLTEKLAERMFGEENWVIGAVAAGLLLFLLTPLQNLADRVAHRAVPAKLSHGTAAERLALYKEQLEIAWADGRLTAKERLLFARLQERLGIDAEAALKAESEVVGTLAKPAKPARNARRRSTLG